MIDALVFPDARAVLFDLIDGHEHPDGVVHAFYQQPADELGAPEGPFPVAVIYATGGSEGYVDRVDRVTVEVFAPMPVAVRVLESIRASIVGDNIETPSGFVDEIRTLTVPVDVPYPSATLSKATASFEVVSRPV